MSEYWVVHFSSKTILLHTQGLEENQEQIILHIIYSSPNYFQFIFTHKIKEWL